MDNFFNSFGIATFLIAFFGGILIGIPIGPARFFIVDTSLNEGKTTALRVYGGFFCAIVFYAALALLTEGLISQHKQIEAVSYFVASLLLIFWGVLIIINSRKENTSSMNINVGPWFMKGLVTGLSNPVTPFIYLAFIQVLKVYTGNISFATKIIFILLFEFFSFSTTAVVTFVLMRKREQVLGLWKWIKLMMGLLLLGLGAFNSYQQLDFSDGVKIKQHESFIEKEAKI